MREDEIVKASGAEVLKSHAKDIDYCISTDTRTIKEGDLYLPLNGANFDGEKFIADALQKGAAGYFTTQNIILDTADVIFKGNDKLKTYL